jgi:hypothetical protein
MPQVTQLTISYEETAPIPGNETAADPLAGDEAGGSDNKESVARQGVRNITAHYSVVGYKWESNTRMNFTTVTGAIIQIYDGDAFLHSWERDESQPDGHRYFQAVLCEGNVRCASFESVVTAEHSLEELLNQTAYEVDQARYGEERALMARYEASPEIVLPWS